MRAEPSLSGSGGRLEWDTQCVQPILSVKRQSLWMDFFFRPQEALTQAEAKGGNLHGFQIDVSAVGG